MSKVFVDRRAASVVSTVVLSWAFPAQAGVPIDLVLRPSPQSFTDSCQSFGLAFAAASVPGSLLTASSAKELRVTEQELRKARDAIARADGEDPLAHTVWKKAIEQVSSGALTADVRYVNSIAEFYKAVEAHTGVLQAETLGTVLTAALVKTPVLTSVTSLGTSTYGKGHIVAVLGVAKGNQSPLGLAVLNSAVKVGPSPEKVACNLDDTVGDMKYQAFASVERKYKLKPFEGKFLVMTVRKN
jgi:hypothetical protein